MSRIYKPGEEPVPGYQVGKLLGRGGYGEVWEARAPGGAKLALKVIHLSSRPERRALRALQRCKQLRHRNLLPMLSFWLKDDTGTLFDENEAKESLPDTARSVELLLALGLAQKSLLDRLRECRDAGQNGIPRDELLDYMEGAAEALDYLAQASNDLGNGAGIVQHGNLKPQNLLIADGKLQLADFGLTPFLAERPSGPALASLPYMAPEVLTSGKPSPATDQYALAICYAELRTGALPFDHGARGPIILAHVEGKLDFASLPRPEQAVLRRATALDPAARFPSTTALVRELRRAGDAGTEPPGSEVPMEPLRLASLVALTEGPSIILDRPVVLVGRHPECDVQIKTRRISRIHCCLAVAGEHVVVRDLDSTNGVLINGVRVREGRLKAGDELAIGSNVYRVQWDMVGAAPARPAAENAEDTLPPQMPAPVLRPPDTEMSEIPRTPQPGPTQKARPPVEPPTPVPAAPSDEPAGLDSELLVPSAPYLPAQPVELPPPAAGDAENLELYDDVMPWPGSSPDLPAEPAASAAGGGTEHGGDAEGWLMEPGPEAPPPVESGDEDDVRLLPAETPFEEMPAPQAPAARDDVTVAGRAKPGRPPAVPEIALTEQPAPGEPGPAAKRPPTAPAAQKAPPAPTPPGPPPDPRRAEESFPTVLPADGSLGPNLDEDLAAADFTVNARPVSRPPAPPALKPIDDEALESLDDPVALPDASGVGYPAAGPPDAGAATVLPAGPGGSGLYLPRQPLLRRLGGRLRRLFRGRPRGPGDTAADWVHCTVFSAPTVRRAETVLVQVFAHTPQQADEAGRLALEFDPDTSRRAFKSLETEVQQGSRLTFHLSIPGLTVSDPVQHLVWLGQPASVQFDVAVPAAVPPGVVIGTVTASLHNVPIGHIKFKLTVAAGLPTAVDRPAVSVPLGDAAHRYRRAFVSYASRDRREVLKRVQMLPRLRIQFFHDVLSLEPGERWEQKLYRYIDQSDLFLLFWSSAASQSPYVREELRYALQRKGDDDTAAPEILPVIIEGPPPPPPPQELTHLHFNDYLLYFMAEPRA